jgi:hypothetical protein
MCGEGIVFARWRTADTTGVFLDQHLLAKALVLKAIASLLPAAATLFVRLLMRGTTSTDTWAAAIGARSH